VNLPPEFEPPRADVGSGALAGALTGLLMLFLTDTVSTVAAAPLLVVVVAFLVSYFLPARKVEAGAIAGAVVMVAIGIYTLVTTGSLADEATFAAGVAYLAQILISYVIAPRQP
jgi:hypothetical protein